MDTLDIKILNILRKNSRISFYDIGKEINISTSAVEERVRKLEYTGVIDSYSAIINKKAFEKNLTALVFISLESPKYIDGIIEFVAEENDILESHCITGNYDLMLKIVTSNPSTLELLINKIKSQNGIIKSLTSIVLSTIKNEYSILPDTYNCNSKIKVVSIGNKKT